MRNNIRETQSKPVQKIPIKMWWYVHKTSTRISSWFQQCKTS